MFHTILFRINVTTQWNVRTCMETHICLLSAFWFSMSSYRKDAILCRQLWNFWLNLHEFFPFHHGCLVHKLYFLFILFYFTLLTTPYFILLSYSSSICIQTFLIILAMELIYSWMSQLLIFFYFVAFILCKFNFTLFY